MSSGQRIRVATPIAVQQKLRGGPAIFLSASVPYRRNPPADLGTVEREAFLKLNERYLGGARPAHIRSAVVALTRAMLMRGMRLVFGAHPAISPMVLGAARDADAPPKSILIFQSEYFRRRIPQETLDLAAWEAGVLVLTPEVAKAHASESTRRAASLKRMRELMVAVPGLRAAIFVGGMEGVAEEAELFRRKNPELPLYALASTGSAARELWDQSESRYSGTLRESSVLDNPSFTIVAHEIMNDLRIEGGKRIRE